jgi:adenylate kinase
LSDIVLLGAPGSGKGTQASRIAAEHRWVHISTGDLFRMHLQNETPLGTLAKSYVDRGDLVPDEVTVDMVRDRLERVPTDARVIYDGFPRTVRQAEALDELLRELGRTLAGAVLLDVPREELVRRMTKRATCVNCQTVYSLDTRPPKRAGVCDRCGGKVVQRSDETPDIIARRLDVYDRQTSPLVDLYAKRGRLKRVDGNGSPEEVNKRVAEAFA